MASQRSADVRAAPSSSLADVLQEEEEEEEEDVEGEEDEGAEEREEEEGDELDCEDGEDEYDERRVLDDEEEDAGESADEAEQGSGEEEGEEDEQEEEKGAQSPTQAGTAAASSPAVDVAVISLASRPPSQSAQSAPLPVESGEWAQATVLEADDDASPSAPQLRLSAAAARAKKRQQQQGDDVEQQQQPAQDDDAKVHSAAINEGASSKATPTAVTQEVGEKSELRRHEQPAARTAGVEAADETDEGGEEDDVDEDEDDEEPLLKYQRVGADVSRLLHSTAAQPPQDTARCLVAHSKFLLLGTSSGAVYVLDLAGNEIAHYSPHSGPVNDLSLDSSGEYVASASSDGSVSVLNLYSRDAQRHHVGGNVLSVALPAGFKSAQMWAAGSSDGRLIVNKKGWFSANNLTIHSGEGPVRCVRWRREFIAWSNDRGVKVYDVNSSERITHIKFEQDELPAAAAASSDSRSCSLHWSGDDELVIAFGRSVKVGRVKERPLTKAERQAHPERTHTRFVQISSIFSVDFTICGIAHFGSDLLLLALPDPDEDDEADNGGTAAEVQRPELHIVSRAGHELRVDVLPIHGYEVCSSKDYRLSSLHDDDSCQCFFVIAPHDLLTARPRDADDHIAWLQSMQRFHDALLFVQSTPPPALHSHSRQGVVDAYLDHLFSIHSYAQCAAECSRLLGLNQQLWEAWIHRFKQQHRLSFIVQAVPTFNPQLTAAVYEEVLLYFLDPNNKEERDKEASASSCSSSAAEDDGYSANLSVLLRLITSWNKHIYDSQKIISAIKASLSAQSAQQSPQSAHPLLLESLAELYLMNKQYHLALSVYLGLRRHDIFTLIRELQLFHVISDKLLQLMAFDSTQAVQLLVDNHDKCSVQDVMSQLAGHPQYQYLYLHRLVRQLDYAVPDLTAAHADLLLSLYADYNPGELLHFLRASQQYNVDRALELCERRGLDKELIFLYKQQGNSQLALRIILHKLHSVHMAIEFVEDERDPLLWEELIAHSVHDSAMLGELLLYVGEYAVDLVKLVQRVPEQLDIPGLKQKLIGILRDQALQLHVLKAGRKVMEADVEQVMDEKRRKEAQGVAASTCDWCGLTVVGLVAGRPAGSRRQRRPRRKRGEPLPEHDERKDGRGAEDGARSVVVFFCQHVYHSGCLVRAHRDRRSDADRSAGAKAALSCIRCAEQQVRGQRRQRDDRPHDDVNDAAPTATVPPAAAEAVAAKRLAGSSGTVVAKQPTYLTAQPVAQPAAAASKGKTKTTATAKRTSNKSSHR